MPLPWDLPIWSYGEEYGFHYPDCLLALLDLLVLLQEDGVLAGEVVGHREEVVPGLDGKYSLASAWLPSFSSCFLYFLRFLTSRSFRQIFVVANHDTS